MAHIWSKSDRGAFRTTSWVKLSLFLSTASGLASMDAVVEQSGHATVGRFFCNVAALQLRFGCNTGRESLSGTIGVMTLFCTGGSLHLWLATKKEGDSCPYIFGAGGNMLRQAHCEARRHVLKQVHLRTIFWSEDVQQMPSERRSRKVDATHHGYDSRFWKHSVPEYISRPPCFLQ